MPHRLFPALLIAALCAACNATAQVDKPVVTAPGRLEAGATLPLGVAVSGTIAEVLVHEGDRVAAGQVLVRISCEALEKELEARKAFLATAEAALARAINGPRPEEVGIVVAN